MTPSKTGRLVLLPSVLKTAMSIADIPQLQKLTGEEKLQLIDELWCSLSPEDISVSRELMAELDHRLADHEANPQAGLTLEEFKRRFDEFKK